MKQIGFATRQTGVSIRFSVVLFALAASIGAASAQTAEEQIQNAYNILRSERSLFMRLDGTEIDGATTHHLMVDAYWDTTLVGEKTVSRLKMESYKDDVKHFLATGDGTSLWNLDLLRNEYRVSTYGSFTAKQPDSYQQDLLQSAVAESRDASVFPARILRDVYGGSGALFKTWTPGTSATVAGALITYSVGDPLRRQVSFLLDDKTGALLSISYFDSKGDQEVSWTINFYSFLTPPADWNFDFAPPNGSKPVVAQIH